jgi:hypothetical protein
MTRAVIDMVGELVERSGLEPLQLDQIGVTAASSKRFQV